MYGDIFNLENVWDLSNPHSGHILQYTIIHPSVVAARIDHKILST